MQCLQLHFMRNRGCSCEPDRGESPGKSSAEARGRCREAQCGRTCGSRQT